MDINFYLTLIFIFEAGEYLKLSVIKKWVFSIITFKFIRASTAAIN